MFDYDDELEDENYDPDSDTKLRIFINDDDVSSGTVTVSWKISPELIRDLAEAKINEPYVLITIAPVSGYHIRKEFRTHVPLKDMIAYTELHVAGENRIFARITDHPKSCADQYTSKQNGKYSSHVLSDEGTRHYSGGFDLHARPLWFASPITVNVPKDCFAKEPPAWEKRWVYWLSREKAIDQCDYRRRRLFSYTVQPILLLLSYVGGIFGTLICHLYGAKEKDLKCLYMPLTYTVLHTGDMIDSGSNYFGNTGSFADRMRRVPLMPGALLFYGFIISMISLRNHLPRYMLYVSAAYTGINLGIFLIMSLVAFVKRDKGERSAKPLPLPWYMQDEERKFLAQGKTIRSIKDLPKNKKTVKLIFNQIKTKVCKPFSK